MQKPLTGGFGQEGLCVLEDADELQRKVAKLSCLSPLLGFRLCSWFSLCLLCFILLICFVRAASTSKPPLLLQPPALCCSAFCFQQGTLQPLLQPALMRGSSGVLKLCFYQCTVASSVETIAALIALLLPHERRRVFGSNKSAEIKAVSALSITFHINKNVAKCFFVLLSI